MQSGGSKFDAKDAIHVFDPMVADGNAVVEHSQTIGQPFFAVPAGAAKLSTNCISRQVSHARVRVARPRVQSGHLQMCVAKSVVFHEPQCFIVRGVSQSL